MATIMDKLMSYKVLRGTNVVVLSLLGASQIPVLKDMVDGFFRAYDGIYLSTVMGIIALGLVVAIFQRKL